MKPVSQEIRRFNTVQPFARRGPLNKRGSPGNSFAAGGSHAVPHTHASRRVVGLVALDTALIAAPGHAEPADPAALAYERFKSLAGTWQADSTKGWSEEITIEVIARGSVVMSTTTFRDAPDSKMVTLYSLDGTDLVATHYCEAGKQPHLVAIEIGPEAKLVRFTFARGGNLASRDEGHMDEAVFRIAGDDEFSSQWTWYKDGREDWMEEIQYRRLR